MLTTDRNEPKLHQSKENGQNEAYLVLSEDELMKGFIRPVRKSYKHTKCNTVTTMNDKLAETYARDPKFYGATFCTTCKTHLPVTEFTWDSDGTVVGS